GSAAPGRPAPRAPGCSKFRDSRRGRLALAGAACLHAAAASTRSDSSQGPFVSAATRPAAHRGRAPPPASRARPGSAGARGAMDSSWTRASSQGLLQAWQRRALQTDFVLGAQPLVQLFGAPFLLLALQIEAELVAGLFERQRTA